MLSGSRDSGRLSRGDKATYPERPQEALLLADGGGSLFECLCCRGARYLGVLPVLEREEDDFGCFCHGCGRPCFELAY